VFGRKARVCGGEEGEDFDGGNFRTLELRLILSYRRRVRFWVPSALAVSIMLPVYRRWVALT
jgi:hypothetical protein